MPVISWPAAKPDIVVQQASEIIPVKGVVLVGPLPIGNSKDNHLCGRHLIGKAISRRRRKR